MASSDSTESAAECGPARESSKKPPRKRPRVVKQEPEESNFALNGISTSSQNDGSKDDDDDNDDDKTPSKNAEACRRSRMKRKAMMDYLRKRNEELEEQRHIYLERIAELQMRVSSMHHAHGYDISRENELLRIEIAKNKAFVDSIVAATSAAPHVLVEERVRLLRSAIEAKVDQIAGLVHSSATWVECGKYKTPSGFTFSMRYQTLPYGVPVSQAKRLSWRVEWFNVPIHSEEFADRYWRAKKIIWEAKFIAEGNRDGILRRLTTYEPDEILEAMQHIGSSNLSCQRYHETEFKNGEVSKKTLSMLSFVRSSRKVEPKDVLGSEVSPPPPKGLVNMPLSVYSDFLKELQSIELQPTDEPDSILLTSPFESGIALIPGKTKPDGTPVCHLIDIYSMPMGYYHSILTAKDLEENDGQLVKKMMSTNIELMWKLALQDDALQDPAMAYASLNSVP